VGDISEELLLFAQQGLNTVGHPVEIPREVGQFVLARTDSRRRPNRKVSIRDSTRDSLQGPDRRREVARENQAKQSAGQSGQQPLKNCHFERIPENKIMGNQYFSD
jgi:hypothetical protein